VLTTPVLLLIFNRPETTRQVFHRVRDARPTRLYLAADGPRPGVLGEMERCEDVRSIADEVDWPCRVLRLFRESNLGCKEAVSSALTWFFDNEPEGIVLEDDCLPAPDFFPYCQEILAHHRHSERVKMVSGTNYLLNSFDVAESYMFSRYFSIWGWASWSRVWRQYDSKMAEWPHKKQSWWLRQLYEPDYMVKHIERLFDLAYDGRINTWDIQMTYSCLLNDGVAVVPKVNLISNIGISGTHTSWDTSNHMLPVFDLYTRKIVHPVNVEPNSGYDFRLYEKLFRPSFGRTIRGLINRVMTQVQRVTE